ncbi:MAG: NAD(P)/FAD-dependent oxidoreductase [Euryarchaeota archaeon]|nr:NAD(P)/FAD-dependent oxidoreductase [Euryarchaeota archaeon]
MLECDVLVVGAGPAGASAAYFCSREGLETVLIEKNEKIGVHTAPKIDSSPNIQLEKIIKKFGLPVRNHVKFSRWYAPSGDCFTLKSETGEFYFKRGGDDSYEVIVSRKAQENGAEIITGIDFLDIVEGDKIEKVKIRTKSAELNIKPKLIIAADGGNSFFHKFVKKDIFNILVGYGISGYDFTSSDCSSIYLHAELLPGGYFYVVTCPDGLSSAGAVVSKKSMVGDISSHFNRFVRSVDSLYEIIMDESREKIGNYRGAGYIFKLDRLYYKNLIFIGDAGGFIDPLLGYGMTPAILSAYLAYEAVTTGSGENGKADNIGHKYEETIRKFLSMDKYYLYREIFESMDNDDFNWIINFLNKINKKVDIGKFLDDSFI